MPKPRGTKRKHHDVDLLVSMIVAEMLDDDPPREEKPSDDPPRRTPRKSNDK